MAVSRCQDELSEAGGLKSDLTTMFKSCKRKTNIVTKFILNQVHPIRFEFIAVISNDLQVVHLASLQKPTDKENSTCDNIQQSIYRNMKHTCSGVVLLVHMRTSSLVGNVISNPSSLAYIDKIRSIAESN